MRRLITALAVVALPLALVACGGDDGGAVAGDTTAAADTDATTGDTETVTSDTGLQATGEHADEEFCVFQENLNASDSPFDDPDATPDDFEAYFDEVVDPALAKLVETAPAELADQVAILADGLGKVGDVLRANDWSIDAAFNDPELNALSQSEEYNAAGTAVDAYCGF
ncbi:MAG: hypothetical protein RL238_118 [Actinomycetota bacterium]|jgi:hypothetical protein